MAVIWGSGAEIDLNQIFEYNEKKEAEGEVSEGFAIETDVAIREFARELVSEDGSVERRWIGRRCEVTGTDYYIFFVILNADVAIYCVASRFQDWWGIARERAP